MDAGGRTTQGAVAENSYLAGDAAEAGPLDQLLGHSMHVIAHLAALVPKPRVNLTRIHGVFAPNSKHLSQVTPARRVKGSKPKAPDEGQQKTPAERHVAIDRFSLLQNRYTCHPWQ